ncbi:threonine/homoserine/homoserine lactone efflux protein [Jatrophihabitans sp. GAS493]|uniref:LysE family translocator n=1 Tax=Jatrophihabitans sp. GAS493 TaxID=1907575 RepID=UPI000BB884DC|nr:LysE family translocator [Jatrophihabitans sp. GAS493]SOD72682.1 threonine/homoserine/homoserine lactone efflux protein [Jatrophihabitans sp. GAS493]
MTLWRMLAFGLAVLPICLTPGVSFTLVTQRVLTRGAGAGISVILGTSCGLICHATLAGLGLSALVMQSSEAFTVVKLAGAGYLVALGLRSLWRARPRRRVETSQPGDEDGPGAATRLPWQGRGDFLQGFLGNVLNPKAAAVYLTIAPQFLHAGSPLLPQTLLLGLAHIAVATSWLLTWTLVVQLSRRTFSSAGFRRSMDRISGAVLVALGLRTAAATR